MDEKEIPAEDKLWKLAGIFAIIFVVWGVSGKLVLDHYNTLGESGTFGDSFGAVNSLFSGLAFGGIIYTILLQRKELNLQRQELILTRKELVRTADAQEKSNSFQFEQLRISNMPLFQYDTVSGPPLDHIVISNESGKNAFDLEIFLFVLAFEEDDSKKQFINQHVNERAKDRIDSETVYDGIWAIYEREVYPSLGNDTRIVIPLNYPLRKSGMEVLIQYRDGLDNNYAQKIIFQPSDDSKSPFITADFEPKVLKVSPRLNFFDEEFNKGLNPNFAWETHNLLLASVFGGYLVKSRFNTKDSKWRQFKPQRRTANGRLVKPTE